MMQPAPARYGVIGHPIGHSRSPWIHARFAQQTRQALTYEAIDSPPDGFAATLQRLQQQGFAGANVTVPFKLQAFNLAQHCSPRVQLAQAANTLQWQPDGSLYADNTDGGGLVHDIAVNAGFALAKRHVLLLGAGGASAGVLGALIEQGPASITIANRTPDKALALAQRHAGWAHTHGVALHGVALQAVLQPTAAQGGVAPATMPPAFDLLINGTSSSLGGEPLHLPAHRMAPQALVYDMMYGAAAQPFLQQAAASGAARGVQVRDGLGMLVEQAALAFALWRGVAPDTAAVLQALRAQMAAAAQQQEQRTA